MRPTRLLPALLATFFTLPALADEVRRPIGPTDPVELEAFLAGLIPALMEEHDAPGAVFVLVKDGQLFFARGYGEADPATGRPVDPETTQFRVASVSKLFATIAALQQVEQGKLDLHADVEDTIDFALEPAWDEPVTLHHLLTHTAGFDDRFLRSSRRFGTELPPLGEYLAGNMPPRVMPPGKLLSYSNHGFALVGHLVEKASGEAFPEYVDRHVLAPLGMERSRFFLDVPLSSDVAVPHRIQDGEVKPFGYDHTLLGPAAELVTTGHDMARFMISQLQLGRIDGVRVLGEDTSRLMQETQFRHHPALDGWAYGYVEATERDVRRISHGGSWRGFRTLMTIVPEADLGLFLSVNVELQGPFFQTFLDTFIDRYYPPAPAPPAELEGVDLAEYAGVYVPNRRMRSTFLKLGMLLGIASVAPDADGVLTVRTATRGPVRFVPVGPDLFRERDGESTVAFLRDESGDVRHFAVDQFAFDRTGLFDSPVNQGIVAVACTVLFVGTLLGWALGLGARLVAGAAPSPVSATARLVGALAAILWTIAVVGVAQNLSVGNLFELLYESLPGSFAALLWLPVAAALPSLALPFFAWRGVEGKAPLARLHLWALAIAAWLMLAIAWSFNLGP